MNIEQNYCRFCHKPCADEFCDETCYDEYWEELRIYEGSIAEDLPGESHYAGEMGTY